MNKRGYMVNGARTYVVASLEDFTALGYDDGTRRDNYIGSLGVPKFGSTYHGEVYTRASAGGTGTFSCYLFQHTDLSANHGSVVSSVSASPNGYLQGFSFGAYRRAPSIYAMGLLFSAGATGFGDFNVCVSVIDDNPVFGFNWAEFLMEKDGDAQLVLPNNNPGGTTRLGSLPEAISDVYILGDQTTLTYEGAEYAGIDARPALAAWFVIDDIFPLGGTPSGLGDGWVVVLQGLTRRGWVETGADQFVTPFAGNLPGGSILTPGAFPALDLVASAPGLYRSQVVDVGHFKALRLAAYRSNIGEVGDVDDWEINVSLFLGS
jgi:hypothetical protein